MSAFPTTHEPVAAPVRVALLGYGYAGKTFHAPLLNATSGLELRVVSSSQADTVRAVLPKVEVVPEAREAATQAGVDLVVVATPNETHAPLARAALEAGKHVVIDKPFALTMEEARALCELAAKQRRLLSVFHNRRWDSDFLALRALLAEDALGRVTHLESRFDRFRPQVRQRWREQARPGAGIWYDLGPHLVDQALQLFGLPDSVTGLLGQHRDGATVDDWSQVTLTYPQRHVILQASMLIAGGMPRFAVHGTKASWLKYGMDTQEDHLKEGKAPGTGDWGRDPAPGSRRDGATGEVTPTSAPRGDYRQYYAALRAALESGTHNPVTPAEALAVMAVVEAARRSATTGCAEKPDLTPEEHSAFEATPHGA